MKHTEAIQPIEVLFEDNHLLVVVKPPGIPSQADESGDPDMLTLLKQDLKQRYNKPGNVYLGLVHRLDRPVGGVMLFAKTSKAAARLSEAVRSRAFSKTYLAVADGKPHVEQASLVHHLLKDNRTNTVQVVPPDTAGSKEARLAYNVVSVHGQYTLLVVDLHTGRPHQIRVQLAAIGCPLIGDLKYGRRLDSSSSGASFGVSTVALWSASLRIAHPVTKEALHFTSEPAVSQKPWLHWEKQTLRQIIQTR